jgi:hypothetical protein
LLRRALLRVHREERGGAFGLFLLLEAFGGLEQRRLVSARLREEQREEVLRLQRERALWAALCVELQDQRRRIRQTAVQLLAKCAHGFAEPGLDFARLILLQRIEKPAALDPEARHEQHARQDEAEEGSEDPGAGAGHAGILRARAARMSEARQSCLGWRGRLAN